MPKKKYSEFTLAEKLKKIMSAGLPNKEIVRVCDEDSIWLSENSLEKRVEQLLGILHNPNRRITSMLCFIMYDIESDKVRNQVVKYLLKKGCLRIQKSIFLADLTHQNYEAVKNDLAEVQSYYENEDSILVVPISTDYLKAMKVIGKSLDMDIILKTKNTLFF